MLPQEKFKELLSKHVAPALKNIGWKRNGQTFHIREQENWGVINFQKNRYNSKRKVSFLINIGVASKRLFDFYETPEEITKFPKEYDCHWRHRPGYFLPPLYIFTWYSITWLTSTERLGKRINKHLLSRAVPMVMKHITDESLRDLWLSEKPTIYRNNIELYVLLKSIGPEEKADEKLQLVKDLAKKYPFKTEYLNKMIKKLEKL